MYKRTSRKMEPPCQPSSDARNVPRRSGLLQSVPVPVWGAQNGDDLDSQGDGDGVFCAHRAEFVDARGIDGRSGHRPWDISRRGTRADVAGRPYCLFLTCAPPITPVRGVNPGRRSGTSHQRCAVVRASCALSPFVPGVRADRSSPAGSTSHTDPPSAAVRRPVRR